MKNHYALLGVPKTASPPAGNLAEEDSKNRDGRGRFPRKAHSTVTLLAKFLGLSISRPKSDAK
jgi:hypothetical protein